MALKIGKTSFETGFEKGELKGQQRSLLRLLTKRFTNLSEEVRRRVEQMSSEQLDTLADALLTAQSLHELGLEDAPPTP